MASGSDAVRLDNLSKTYHMGEVQIHALRDVDLAIPAGEFVVFLGPSGSGKTTLMNIIGGLDSPTSGRAIVYGRDLTDMNEDELTEYRRADVGFVFQLFNLVPRLTARENVELIADLVPKAQNPVELLERVGLGEHLNHFPSQLSGGEQQRVAIARALVKRPKLLLADEPTGNLDHETSAEVLAVIHEMAQTEAATVIMVTHDESIAQDASMVVRLLSGRVASTVGNHHKQPTPAGADS